MEKHCDVQKTMCDNQTLARLLDQGENNKEKIEKKKIPQQMETVAPENADKLAPIER